MNFIYDELKFFFQKKNISKLQYVFLRFDKIAVHKDCEIDINIADKDFIYLLQKLVLYYLENGYRIKNYRKTRYLFQATLYKGS